MKKKFFSFISKILAIVVFCVCVSNCYFQSVYAVEQVVYGLASWAFYGALNSLGVSVSSGRADEMYSTLQDKFSSLVSTTNADGSVTLSDETMSQLKSIIGEYFAQEENLPEVVWFPVISSDQLSASAFYSTAQYYQFRSVADDISLSIVNTKGSYWNYFYYKDISDCVFHNNGSGSFGTSTKNYFNYMTSIWGNNDTSVSPFGVCMAHSNGTSYTFDDCVFDAKYSDSGREDTTSHFVESSSSLVFNICYPFRANHSYYAYPYYSYVVRGCNTEQFYYVPYFSSVNSYKEWVTGQADYYRVQSSYTGGDITINPNTDYSVVYNNISNTIQNSYAEGKDYSDILSDIQASYDASMKEISESLGNIEDNTGESNSWLEQIEQNTSETNNILEQIEQNTADSNTWLEHIDSGLFDPDGNSWFIQMYLQDMKILEAIQKGFADLLGIFNMDDSDTSDSGGDSSGGSESGDSESGDSESGDSGGDSGGSESGDSGGDSGGDTGGDSGGDIGGIGTGGDSGGSSDDDSGGGGKKSFWTKLGDLASVLFTSVLDLISKILFKALDGLLYLVGVVVDYASLSFDYIGALITRIKDTMLGGTDFFAAVYAEMPEELRDTIGFGCICLLISGLIGFIKAKS